MVRKLGFGMLLILTLAFFAKADVQNVNILNNVLLINAANRPQMADSTVVLTVDSTELNLIDDLRTVFEKHNAQYSAPKKLDEKLLRFFKKDELEISNEALYWARLVREPDPNITNYTTFKDTVIVDPMFLPIVFKGKRFTDEDLTFYSMDFTEPQYKKPSLYTSAPIFTDYNQKKESALMAIRYVEENHPYYIKYSQRDMPQELVKTTAIKKNIYENLQLRVESEADFSDVTPTKFIPERRYWKSGFESVVQFSQNYVSPNWHKGGSSNLNIFTKNVLTYNYAKDKLAVNNLIEYRTSIYTAPKDTIHKYKIGDDVLRLYNDIGYQAFNKWSYNMVTEVKTQVFQNYKENTSQKQASLLAPVTVTFGFGMKYALNKQFKSNRHKKLVLDINLAPLSYKYMYSILKDPNEIDLGRHGFKLDEETQEYKNSFGELGSSVNTQLKFTFNRNVTWESRFNYFTSYENAKLEFENTLVMAISRFFSTRINLNVRFDDSAKKSEDFDSYFQINELISFGFNYKW